MRLLRGKSAVVTRSYSLPQGRSSLRLGLPRSLKRGWYVLAARFAPVGGKAVVIRRPFHFTPERGPARLGWQHYEEVARTCPAFSSRSSTRSRRR